MCVYISVGIFEYGIGAIVEMVMFLVETYLKICLTDKFLTRVGAFTYSSGAFVED